MKNSKEILYFTHIPKCGGQSFKKGLEQAYGDRVQMWYMNPLRHRLKDKVRLSLARLKWNIYPVLPRPCARVVYGHYSFDDLRVPKNVNVSYAAFFRDSVEWFGSFYFYIRDKYPGELPEDPIRLIKKLDLSNAYQKYLGEKSVGDLRYVGITEQYEKSLLLYERMFGVEVGLFHVNKTPYDITVGKKKYETHFQSNDVIGEIKERMRNNQEVYECALDQFKFRCQEFNVDVDG